MFGAKKIEGLKNVQALFSVNNFINTNLVIFKK
jgi:hypothetical protein